MTHRKEINRWAECPDGTNVWSKNASRGWFLFEPVDISWLPSCEYVVDDEHAIYKKAQIDGRNIEVYQGEWYDISKCNAAAQNFRLTPADKYYRVKDDDPVYYWQWEKLDREDGCIMVTSPYTDERANYHGYQVNDGWRKIESSKRTWNAR